MTVKPAPVYALEVNPAHGVALILRAPNGDAIASWSQSDIPVDEILHKMREHKWSRGGI